MSIKFGQILHDAHGFVIDRLQSAGAGNLNIPEERIRELGNFQTVATVRDVPDLSFDLESLDVSMELEAILTDVAPGSLSNGQAIDLNNSKPIDIISPFKTGQGLFTIANGVIVPYLNLENATYRFGTRQNATQQFTLRGSSVYYSEGSPYYQEYVGATGTYAFSRTALPTWENGAFKHALCITAIRPDGTYKRLFHGTDYTDSAAGFTITAGAGLSGSNKIKVVYASATQATYAQTVHEGVSVKPAAVRGKDLDVYIAIAGSTVTLGRWTGVQSFEVTRRVNLENDEEFGNPAYVAQDYDVPEVTGSITVRSVDVDDLFAKIFQITNVTAPYVANALSSTPLPIELRVRDPNTGTQLKTLYVPDARFTPPGIQGRVNQKLDTTFNFSSDTGTLAIYKGAK